MNDPLSLLARVATFTGEAHAALGLQESSKSRVVLLEQTYQKLQGLTLRQDELFRQSLRCAENALFRAAHVMGWAGFMDFFQEKLSTKKFKKLKQARSDWKLTTIEDFRDQHSEYAIIEASRDAGLCTRTEMKALHGLLSKRNECAHPSSFFPGLNETLGFISELFQRIQTLNAKPF
jgi:hypothetical protein